MNRPWLGRTLAGSRALALLMSACAFTSIQAQSNELAAELEQGSNWLVVDNFESTDPLSGWYQVDPDNQTNPLVVDPQVTEVRVEEPGGDRGNHYLVKKPAEDGIVGNRKALSFKALPEPLAVGETATFYTRVNVEYFPNNHSFGLSNLDVEDIENQNYNAFEPMIRITDKYESDGSKNDGTLMVMVEDRQYAKIKNFEQGRPAQPMQENLWYELWYVVNNAPKNQGGQTYDLYVSGGEFGDKGSPQLVFNDASFRMQRELPLIHFVAICNTGPENAPYGNGGVRFDDIYMAQGLQLSRPMAAD